jgi:signal transduction histidine kinase
MRTPSPVKVGARIGRQARGDTSPAAEPTNFGRFRPGARPATVVAMNTEVPARSVAAVIAATALLAGVTVAGLATQPGPHPVALALDIVIGVLSCLGSALVLWRPVTATLGLSLLAILSPAATPAATLGAFQVANRRPLPTAVGVAAAGIGAHAVLGLWRPGTGISLGWWLLLLAAGYGALVGWGALARSHRALVCELRERARRAETEQGRRVAEARMLERTRLAREMHDVLAHRLSLVATYAGALEFRPDSSPEQLARAAGVVRTGVHQALDELRAVVNVLREEDGSEPHPLPAMAELPRLIAEARGAGQSVRFADATIEPDGVPVAIGRTAYRLVQEALTNARRHAAGQPVQVSISGRPGGELEISICNHLRSPQPGEARESGTGLVGLTERVRLAGGRLDHGISGNEFRLHAWLPWPA